MNLVWLHPRPRPDRPGEDRLIDTATIRGLHTRPLPWQELRTGREPHRWALYAHLSGLRAPVELLRGQHEQAQASAATDLARILATERGHFDRDGGGVIVTCGQETPHGVVFDVERTARPHDPRDWWPTEHRKHVEKQERAAAAPRRRWNPFDNLPIDTNAVPAAPGAGE
ncbi:hypothetical protein ABZ234_08190 [Nocardiopsis sp. NPDC006198]|uniref:hypothetical protein n=1 Tax=Nocardiopsis sp. NPDC006198 TaxID=3154472 RepID=UPI0033B5ADAB